MAVPLKQISVIGAGIGGLCTAIALRQAGFSVHVYEQAPAFADIGAGLTLWANAVKGLRQLGMDEALNWSRIAASEIRTANGAVLQRSAMEVLERKTGAPAVAVHRAELHRALMAGLPEGLVQVGKTLAGYEQSKKSVLAYFSDGSIVESDLLIGADGINSAVRRQAFPNARLRYAGYPAWRGVVSARTSMDAQTASESWGCGARFGILPIGLGRTYWFATANLPHGRKCAPEEHKAELLRRFGGWHAPVEALIHETPAEQILYNDIFDFDPLPRWSTGRVVLLGDAAHATTPNLGQGACQAIESSIVLARCLAQDADLRSALHHYQAARRPRTDWITAQSRSIGQVGQVDNPLLCTLRNFVLRVTPPAVMMRTLTRAAGFEIG